MGLGALFKRATTSATGYAPIDDEPLDDRLDEATGEAARLEEAADQVEQGQREPAELEAYLTEEPADEEADLLIPHTPEEREALRDLGRSRYVGFGKAVARGGAGQAAKLVAQVASQSGVPASQAPSLVNAAHTAGTAIELTTLSEAVPVDAAVYQGRGAALKKAIERVSRIRSAKASGQFSSIGVSSGSAVATPVLAAGITTAVAVPPVGLALAVVGIGAGSLASSYVAGKLVQGVSERVRDIDRDEIARVLFDCARLEIAHNARSAPAIPDQEGDPGAPFAVEEYAVRALGHIGVSRALVEDPSTEDRACRIIVRSLS